MSDRVAYCLLVPEELVRTIRGILQQRKVPILDEIVHPDPTVVFHDDDEEGGTVEVGTAGELIPGPPAHTRVPRPYPELPSPGLPDAEFIDAIHKIITWATSIDTAAEWIVGPVLVATSQRVRDHLTLAGSFTDLRFVDLINRLQEVYLHA